MVILWWLADNWGVPKLDKIPTADLLLGVGLVGLGQVSILLCWSADYAVSLSKRVLIFADTQHQHVQCNWQEGCILR